MKLAENQPPAGGVPVFDALDYTEMVMPGKKGFVQSEMSKGEKLGGNFTATFMQWNSEKRSTNLVRMTYEAAKPEADPFKDEFPELKSGKDEKLEVEEDAVQGSHKRKVKKDTKAPRKRAKLDIKEKR